MLARKPEGCGLDPQRRAMIDERLPWWLPPRPRANDERWLSQLEEVLAYYRQHGRFPHAKHPQGGLWLENQRQIARGNRNYPLDPRRRAVLDQLLPGWLKAPTPPKDDATWAAQLDRVVAHYEQSGRFPAYGTQLGRWFHTQRQLARGNRRYPLDPQRWAMLDERLPGWLLS